MNEARERPLWSLLDRIKRQLNEEHPETDAAIVGFNLPIGLIDQALADFNALETVEDSLRRAEREREALKGHAELIERDRTWECSQRIAAEAQRDEAVKWAREAEKYLRGFRSLQYRQPPFHAAYGEKP